MNKHSPSSTQPKTRFVFRRWRVLALLFLVVLFLAGCSPAVATQISQQVERLFPSIARVTPTPFQPVPFTLTPTITSSPTITPSLTPEPVRELVAWIDPALPPALKTQIHLPLGTKITADPAGANLSIAAIRGGLPDQVTWFYVLAAPFPTLTDETNLDEVQRAWRGEPGSAFGAKLLMSPQTQAAFTARWGPSSSQRVEIVPADELLDAAWERRSDWALLPFEDLAPGWKALRVDGMSLLERRTDLKAYPLSVWFGISGEVGALRLFQERMAESMKLFPAANYQPEKMTILVMSGVTALARATGYKMDTLGTTYPGRDVRDWFLYADLAHVSNEVSFNKDCPKANFYSTSMMFCSRPEYIELLDYLGVDIVELSGNHNNDWGRAAFDFSLDLYHQRGWTYFAGGANLAEANKPARIEHNGNRLAFIGCNPVGPTGVWATDTQPGVAPCADYQWMLDEIKRLREEGYLPIVTIQYYELYIPAPSDHQVRNFRAAIDAGAIIVSGSQAHFPQIMEFYNGGFIHYGLGNLFFDQMDVPVPGTRREFVDRHIFYDGRHIQTELLTALLEDYARPRPMSESERQDFLTDIFKAGGW